VTAWHEEPIGPKHNLGTFDCGDDGVNEFLIRRARKSHQMGGLKTFLAVADQESRTVMGFYSLGPVSVQDHPGFCLPYLAVDRTVQRQGLGGKLLLAASWRCLLVSTKVGGGLLLITTTGDRLTRWYASYGAIELEDKRQFLVLPLASVEKALKGVRKWRVPTREPIDAPLETVGADQKDCDTQDTVGRGSDVQRIADE
jgi:hypothetical protein